MKIDIKQLKNKFLDMYGVRLLILALIGILAVVVSLYFAFTLESVGLVNKIIIAAIAEIGFAALIAVFIVITLDHHEKAKIEREISEQYKRLTSLGFASFIAQVSLPESISERLPDFLGESAIVKRYHNVDTKLYVDGEDILLDESHTFAAYNATNEIISYPLPIKGSNLLDGSYKASIEKRDDDGEWKVVVQKNRFSAPKPENMSKFPVSENSVIVKLRPAEEFRCKVSWTVEKQLNDSHSWTNMINSEKFKLTVTSDSRKWMVGAKLSSPFIDEVKRTEDGVNKFELNHPTAFFRGNSSYIFWNEK